MRRSALVVALVAPIALAGQAPPAWAPHLDSTVRAALDRSGAPGASVAVVADGRLVYAQAYGLANVETQQPMTPETLFRIGSVTKMFTGATLAELSVRGQLRLDQPIGTIVPELAGRRVGTVTTHQLLTHTAGWLDNAVPYGRMGEGALGEVMREVGDTLFFTDPGRTVSYSNPGYSMAGYVAEVAAGARFATLVTERVLQPLGQTRATFRPLEALTWPTAMGHSGPRGAMRVVRPMTENTAQWAAGFLFASATDVARLAIALMDSGRVDGRQAISGEAARLVTHGHVAIPGTPPADSQRYGYGVMSLRRGGIRVWQHNGAINGYHASVTMLPDHRTAVVVLANADGATLPGVATTALRLAAGVAPPPPSDPSPARAATAAERARLVGRYAMGRTTVELAEGGDSLQFVQNGMRFPALVTDAGEVVVQLPAGDPPRLTWSQGTDGRAAYLHTGLRALARQP